MAKKMSTHELKSLLTSERAGAMGTGTSSRLAEERTTALQYYEGDMPDMVAPDGRSKAVSTDVQEAIDGLMPSLMDIFASTDDVVKFTAIGPEDEDAAAQETDYINHVFWQKNPGFIVLYSFIKDALLSKNGIVKVYWEETTKESRETYEGLSEDEYALLAASVAQSTSAEIVEHTIGGEEAGENVGLHSCVVVHTREHGVAKVDPIPPEEFLISRKARNLQGASYMAHRVYRTRAELKEQGYDATQVDSLSAREQALNVEETARNTVEDFQARNETTNADANLVEVLEHYVKCDYEGDGVSRIYRVTAAGQDGEILTREGEPDVEAVDMFPFASMTPVIMTHRFFGRSIADLVADIQRIKTALYRALLDNTYLANNQRYEVAEAYASERTIDDLLVNRPGGIVRVKQPGGINALQSAPIGPFVFPLIEYVDSIKEARTGVSKTQQGLDANALQNQSATAANQLYSAAQQKVKLIARIFAETGIRDMFMLLHGVIRKNATRPDIVKLRNTWVPVNPRDWIERNDMTVDVGLGNGSKAEQVSNLMLILNAQKEAVLNPQAGLAEPKHIYNTFTKLLPLIGQRNVEAFFNDPSQNPPQPNAPAPDPNLIKAQGQLQIEQAKAEHASQMAQAQASADLQLNQQKMQAALEAGKADAQMQLELQREKIQQEFQLKREQLAAEIQLKRDQMVLEVQLKRELGNMQTAAAAATDIAGPSFGGEPG